MDTLLQLSWLMTLIGAVLVCLGLAYKTPLFEGLGVWVGIVGFSLSLWWLALQAF